MSEKSDELEYQAIAFHLEEAMRNAKIAGRHDLKPNGQCHNCHEIVEELHLFCDQDCAEDHRKRTFAQTQRLY